MMVIIEYRRTDARQEGAWGGTDLESAQAGLDYKQRVAWNGTDTKVVSSSFDKPRFAILCLRFGVWDGVRGLYLYRLWASRCSSNAVCYGMFRFRRPIELSIWKGLTGTIRGAGAEIYVSGVWSSHWTQQTPEDCCEPGYSKHCHTQFVEQWWRGQGGDYME